VEVLFPSRFLAPFQLSSSSYTIIFQRCSPMDSQERLTCQSSLVTSSRRRRYFDKTRTGGSRFVIEEMKMCLKFLPFLCSMSFSYVRFVLYIYAFQYLLMKLNLLKRFLFQVSPGRCHSLEEPFIYLDSGQVNSVDFFK